MLMTRRSGDGADGERLSAQRLAAPTSANPPLAAVGAAGSPAFPALAAEQTRDHPDPEPTMTTAARFNRLSIALLLSATALTLPALARAQAATADTVSQGAEHARLLPIANAESESVQVSEVVITSRHRSEDAQKVPVAASVIGGEFLTKTNTSTISQVAQYVPSLQFTFFNARNANINIRGLGNNIGLANDGIEPGVGFYVDGVYYDRPATATFDLVDLDKVEVLRGPQGTLFGKNTTAGAINITTEAPTSVPHAQAEASGGNLGYFQFKGAVSGPIFGDVLTGRLSVAGTTREGLLTNVYSGKTVNAYRNRTVRAQLAYRPNENLKVRLIGDYSRQDTNCCDLVLSGIVSPPNGKNFNALTAMFGYTPVINPFARQADTNSTIQARQETGGVSAQVDWTLPQVTLTSVTAWRFWNWWPSNDSDYTPLSVLTASQNGDHQRQVSQEVRIASNGVHKLDYVGGLYVYNEQISAIGKQQFGNAASAFLLKSTLPSVVADGYTLNFRASYHTNSLATFGQAVWHITPRLNLTGGLRYTYDHKSGWFSQIASGGAPLTGPLAALAPFRAALGTSAAFTISTNEGDLSGMGDLSYQITPDILAYATYSHGDKSGGLNLTQLPAGASAVIAPETLDHYEIGAKTRLFDRRVTVNADLFWEDDHNYQANIVDPALGKQYLSNVPKVRSRGVEVDITAQPSENWSLYASGIYDDAIYQSYVNGVCPLETITQPHCDLSGKPLAGTPEWTISAGGEFHHAVWSGAEGYLGVDYRYRSSVYSAATDSIYSRLGDLSVADARLGVRSQSGRWDAYLWAKNLTDEKYFTFTAAGVGNTGALVSQLGDPRAFGGTFRLRY